MTEPRPPQGEFRSHGMGLEPVEPDWPPLTLDEVSRLLHSVLGLATAGGATDGSGAEIMFLSPRPFSAAAVVRLGDGRELFVKRHDRRVRDEASLGQEHRYLAWLQGQGFPVPMVLSHDGSTAFTLESGPETDLYEVHTVAPGTDRYKDALSWTAFQSTTDAWAAGVFLARLHQVSSGYEELSPLPRGARPLWSSIEVVSAPDPLEAIDRLAKGPLPGLGAFLAGREWRREIGEALGRWSPDLGELLRGLLPLWTHNDWHPSNLLWDDAGATGGASTVTAAIDFGLCNRTTACYDLATALERTAVSWLQEYDCREVHHDHARALVMGYRSVRELTAAEVLVLPHLLAVAHVEYALSEIEYFAGVLGDLANAELAYLEYLIGHLQWFSEAAGREMLEVVADAACSDGAITAAMDSTKGQSAYDGVQ